MEDELTAAGAELIRLPVASKNPGTILSNARKLTQLTRKRNIALIHARSRAPAWSALRSVRATRVPFVTTFHGIYGAGNPLKRIYNSVMLCADAVIANSEWTAAHIRQTYRTKPKRLVVIPRGLDLSVFDPATVTPGRIALLREKWSLHAGEHVLLLPGRLTRWKGQLVLIEALAALKRAGKLAPDLRVVILGHAQGRKGYVAEVVAAIAGNGLKKMVVLAGHEPDLAAAYGMADIVVSASTDPEAFGRVAAEAGAMGLPVIATDHGGARETVLAGESGILVPPGDADALAAAIVEMLVRPKSALVEMGAKGRAHVAAHFTVEKMCADTLALYRDLIGIRAKP